MPRSMGHQQGMKRMIALLEHAYDVGIPYVTVYALSTENLRRPQVELEGLYNLVRNYFAEYMRNICSRGVRLRIVGDISPLPQDVQDTLTACAAETEKYAKDGRELNFAFGYGSRAEIVRAVNRAVQSGERVTEESFSNLLYTEGQPDPDLVIRTGKECRLSNFLLYQAAYAELYFSKRLFPDFSNRALDEAIVWFSKRTRRFGKTDEQLKK